MAQRRMFSLQIIDTDAFMDMPLSTQALYFHLGMRADDDGFVSNARRVQKLVGASDDDLKILAMKRFILVFESGVIVIKHWKISNYIQKDRYRQTLYKEEKATLFLKPDGVYTDHPMEGAKPCIQPVSEPDEKPELEALPDHVSEMDTFCIHRIGKESIGKDNFIYCGGGGVTREEADEAVEEFLRSRGKLPGEYFGINEAIIGKVEMFAQALFKKFTSRKPTEADVSNVFFAIRHSEQDPQTKDWLITFPQDSKDLLMYAFERAATAGKPGDWNYINGILRNLKQRDIKNLVQADDFDFERDEK